MALNLIENSFCFVVKKLFRKFKFKKSYLKKKYQFIPYLFNKCYTKPKRSFANEAIS